MDLNKKVHPWKRKINVDLVYNARWVEGTGIGQYLKYLKFKFLGIFLFFVEGVNILFLAGIFVLPLWIFGFFDVFFLEFQMDILRIPGGFPMEFYGVLWFILALTEKLHQ